MSFGRQTLATSFDIDYSEIYRSGSFKDCYVGRFLDGSRTNQCCVAKVLKSEYSSNSSYLENEIRIADKAVDLVTRFNRQSKYMDIYVNEPDIGRSRFGRTLIEPFIKNFCKYNSNSGWVLDDDSFNSNFMQSLSHFSYHSSGGHHLLCDIQGGSFNKGFALADPVIMSHEAGTWGITDLGRDGIITFFAYHDCNEYCDEEWKRPKHQKPVLDLRRGTSVIGMRPSPGTSRYY